MAYLRICIRRTFATSRSPDQPLLGWPKEKFVKSKCYLSPASPFPLSKCKTSIGKRFYLTETLKYHFVCLEREQFKQSGSPVQTISCYTLLLFRTFDLLYTLWISDSLRCIWFHQPQGATSINNIWLLLSLLCYTEPD